MSLIETLLVMGAPGEGDVSGRFPNLGPENWPVVVLPIVLVMAVLNKLAGSCVRAERSTSANLTSSSTSCAPTGANVKPLTTLLEYAWAIVRAGLAASLGDS